MVSSLDSIELFYIHYGRVSGFSQDFILSYLGEDELYRYRNYKFDKDKIQYLVSRYLLYSVLSKKMGRVISSADINFSDYGKPYLLGGLKFNLSNSVGFVILAISESSDVGVDVESCSSLSGAGEWLELASSCFTDSEIDKIRMLESDAQKNEFIRLWTAKEAYVKFLGVGLNKEFLDVEINSCDSSIRFICDRGIKTNTSLLCGDVGDYKFSVVADSKCKSISFNEVSIHNNSVYEIDYV